MPQAGDIVTIQYGSSLLLDTSPPALGGLIVNGQLTFDDQDLTLTSRWILIDGGSLSIGTETTLHTNAARITLTGTEENDDITAGHGSIGTKFIAVLNGGSLGLHGQRSHSTNWTQLAGHALAGSKELVLSEPVDWKSGDLLVVAPSGFDPTEAEVVTITSIEDKTVQFSPPLQHDHWGELQTIAGHTVDERAEVACLTRNIVIQGDEASAESEFGGHLMFIEESEVRIEGVEFKRMGQKGHPARYPIHWHLAGNRSGDYARGNSIHQSYHRAIVTHGTSNVLVENNVSYDVWSHTYVPSEDGSEKGNRFIDNLGILTRRLAVADYTFPESAAGASFQSEGRPGVFWMLNPDQILIGNHAAGVVNGMGFFFDGPSLNEEWSGLFVNNTAHSCLGPVGNPADHYPTLTVGYGLFMEDQSSPSEIRFQNFTAYKNSLSGVWLEGPGQLAQNAILADNGTGAILFQSTLEDSLIVGQSANTIGTLPQVHTSLSGGVHLVSGSGLRAPQLRTIDFVNQRDAAIIVLGTHLHPQSTLENLSFHNTQPCWISDPTLLIGGFTDVDGSLRGDGIPAFIHGKEPLAVTNATVFDNSINGWVTPLESLQYLSFTDTNPLSEDMGYTVLRREDQVGTLPDTTISGQPVTRSGYLKKNLTYELQRFTTLPDGIRLSLSGTAPGFIVLEMDRPESTFVYEGLTSAFGSNVPDFERLAPMVSDIEAVISGTLSSWFIDPGTQTLYQRLESNRPVYVFDQLTGGIDVTRPEALWQSKQFGYQVVRYESALSIWGSHADPDSDGIKNEMEFFLDTNPLEASNPFSLNSNQRTFSFSKNPDATGMEFSVCYSNNLLTWHTNTEIQETFLSDTHNRVSAIAPPLESTDALFMMLILKHQP